MGRGLLKWIISEQIKHFLWITRHMVNHYIATHPDGQSIGTAVMTNNNNETVVSGLADSSPVARATCDNAVVMELHLQQAPTPTDTSTTTTEALVLAKGATPAEGNWNNNDPKVMIQWFKHDGDRATPKNKDGLLLWYRETHTHGAATYPHEDVQAAAATVADATPTATVATVAHPTFPCASASALSSAATTAQSTHNPKIFALAAAGTPAAAHAAPCCSIHLQRFQNQHDRFRNWNERCRYHHHWSHGCCHCCYRRRREA
jgi:hypothetical protein